MNNKQRVVNQHGEFLIEVIIATFVGVLFAAGILQLYVQSFSLSNATQDQIMVASIAQECIDSLRALPYQTVANSGSVHTALVCGSEGNCTDTLFKWPLLQDTTVFGYSAGSGTSTASGANNRFNVVNNQVSVNVTAQANNTLLVEVALTYIDGTGSHTYTTYTILTPNGLNS